MLYTHRSIYCLDEVFWIYNDRPIDNITLFVLNRFHKDHQEGNRQMSPYDLVIMEATSKMNRNDAALGDVKI